jgi:hypothetical protein
METHQRFVNGLSDLLTGANVPLEVFNGSTIDLKSVFIRLKESGEMSEEVYNAVAMCFKKKPAHIE